MPADMQARTAAHYDAHPFDFLSAEDEARIDDWQPRPFRRFAESCLSAGAHVAEIGCGPGRGTLYLSRRGIDVTAVDVSQRSLLLARARAPGACFVRATNLRLPFRDAAFDAVVSDGVIHHTPDARRAFGENARIAKPGGHLYVAVYHRHGHYRLLYTYAGAPIRSLAARPWGRTVLHATLLPPYFLVHFIRSGGRRTWRGARHFFYDYFATPRATFHTREEIEAWGREEGLALQDYDPAVGNNVHAFVFRKAGAPER